MDPGKRIYARLVTLAGYRPGVTERSLALTNGEPTQTTSEPRVEGEVGFRLCEPHGLRVGEGPFPKGNYYQRTGGLNVGQPKMTVLSTIVIQYNTSTPFSNIPYA